MPGKGRETRRRDRTCVLMGELAGAVCPAASRGQAVDGVILVKNIPHTGKNQVVQVTNGLDVGLRIPEGEYEEETIVGVGPLPGSRMGSERRQPQIMGTSSLEAMFLLSYSPIILWPLSDGMNNQGPPVLGIRHLFLRLCWSGLELEFGQRLTLPLCGGEPSRSPTCPSGMCTPLDKNKGPATGGLSLTCPPGCCPGG